MKVSSKHSRIAEAAYVYILQFRTYFRRLIVPVPTRIPVFFQKTICRKYCHLNYFKIRAPRVIEYAFGNSFIEWILTLAALAQLSLPNSGWRNELFKLLVTHISTRRSEKQGNLTRTLRNVLNKYKILYFRIFREIGTKMSP